MKALQTYSELPPHQQRVIEEALDLEDKIDKLSNFLKSDFYNDNVHVNEKYRLNKQIGVMISYLGILVERINNFTDDSNLYGPYSEYASQLRNLPKGN